MKNTEPHRDSRPGSAVFGILFLVCGLGGCVMPRGASELGVEGKLAKVGIQLVSEDEALLPAGERGRYLPCRGVPGVPGAALDTHPAGYLLVGVVGEATDDAAAIREALRSWSPGEVLVLRVRRNPHRSPASEWWERDVRMVYPEE